MPQSEISAWLQFALQQMAAESYLDGIDWNNAEQVKIQLRLGNNRSGFPESGATRFTGTQTQGLQDQAFVDRYKIVHHHANDSIGFSATLIQERGTNNFTLSFRSTEYKNQVNGGDFERDGANGLFLTGADGEILAKEGLVHLFRHGVRRFAQAGGTGPDLHWPARHIALGRDFAVQVFGGDIAPKR
jgi:hypothetical protein